MSLISRFAPPLLAAVLSLLVTSPRLCAADVPPAPPEPAGIADAPLAPQPGPVSVDAALSVPADYRLDIGDTIRVHVLRHTDVSGNVLIPADGMVRLPRLREPVSARGLTAQELAAALSASWSHVLRLQEGQVSVSVATQRMRRVYVRGNGAARNGDFDLRPNWRIRELMAVAGMGGAPAERLFTIITNDLRPAPVHVDLESALHQPDSPENVALMEGDVVTVRLPRSVRLFVQGEGPRGIHEVDERYGLRRALTQANYTIVNASGSLKDAQLIRKGVEGDPLSNDEIRTFDLRAVMTGEAEDIPLRDLDILYIPGTERQVYIHGEVYAKGIQQLPEDKPAYLADVLSRAGSYSREAKISEILVLRQTGDEVTTMRFDFGRYLHRSDMAHNPEIQAKDIIVVPHRRRPVQEGINALFQGFSVYGIFRSLFGI